MTYQLWHISCTADIAFDYKYNTFGWIIIVFKDILMSLSNRAWYLDHCINIFKQALSEADHATVHSSLRFLRACDKFSLDIRNILFIFAESITGRSIL